MEEVVLWSTDFYVVLWKWKSGLRHKDKAVARYFSFFYPIIVKGVNSCSCPTLRLTLQVVAGCSQSNVFLVFPALWNSSFWWRNDTSSIKVVKYSVIQNILLPQPVPNNILFWNVGLQVQIPITCHFCCHLRPLRLSPEVIHLPPQLIRILLSFLRSIFLGISGVWNTSAKSVRIFVQVTLPTKPSCVRKFDTRNSCLPLRPYFSSQSWPNSSSP